MFQLALSPEKLSFVVIVNDKSSDQHVRPGSLISASISLIKIKEVRLLKNAPHRIGGQYYFEDAILTSCSY